MIVSNEKVPYNQRQLLINIVSGKCKYSEQCNKIYCDKYSSEGFLNNTIENSKSTAAFRLLIEKNIIEKVVEVKEDVDNLNSNLSSVNTTVTVLSTRFSDLNNLNSIPSAGGFGND